MIPILSNLWIKTRRVLSLRVLLIGIISIVFQSEVFAFEQIVITEVDYDGYTIWDDDIDTNSSDEFVELYNTTASDISLNGWELRIISTSGKKIVPLSGNIQSQAYFVIRRVTRSQESSLLPKAGFYHTSLLNLVNSGAYLELRDGTGDTVTSLNRYSGWDPTTLQSDSLQKSDTGLWVSSEASPGNSFSIPKPPVTVYGGIRITELLPDPVGDDGVGEFIEVYNDTSKDIDLTGWTLDDLDGGGSQPQILENIIIPSQTYKTIAKPVLKISLNNYSTDKNAYDEVILLDPNKKEQSRVKYSLSEVKESWSYQLFNDTWVWNNPASPNGINISPPISSPSQPNNPLSTIPPKSTPVPNSSPSELSYAPGSVIISEIYPYPLAGEAEFIELYNTTDGSVDLKNWILVDGAKRSQIASILIPPKSYYILNQSQSLIYLNNTQESLKLYDPKEILHSELFYSKAFQGKSYNYFSFGWGWSTTLTPGAINIFEDSGTSSQGDIIQSIETIRDLERIQDGELITIEGRVFIPPGIISETVWYIEKNGEIMKVSNRGKRFQDILIGDTVVSLTAEWHRSDTQMYLSMAKNSDVKQGSRYTVYPIQSIPYVTDWGNSISIAGVIIGKRSNTLTVDIDGKEYPVKLYGIAKDIENLKKDAMVTIEGITEQYDGETRLIVWDTNQINIVTADSNEKESHKKDTSKSSKNDTIVAHDTIDTSLLRNREEVHYSYQDLSEFNIQEIFRLDNSSQPLTIQANLSKGMYIIRLYPWFSIAVLLNSAWWIYRLGRWALLLDVHKFTR